MIKKEFSYRGKSLEELKKLDLSQFMELIPSNQRRHLKRGLTDQEKKLMKNIRAEKRNIETHCREMIVLPEMVGILLKIHTGKEFFTVTITEDMLGHRLGEFALTRRQVKHGAAGVGSTRGTAHQSVH